MAILEIKKIPDQILRQKAERVERATDSERKLVSDMFDTMYFANGVGLAAPQVGIAKRIIVCNPTGKKADELALVNPVIVERKGRRIKECEGCLSIPAVSEEVSRFSAVKVTAKDLEWRDVDVETDGLLARILNHEIDHLDGILFIDRIGFIKRKILLAKYKKKTGVSCVGRWY